MFSRTHFSPAPNTVFDRVVHWRQFLPAVLVLAYISTPTARAQVVWTGNTSTDWGTGSNWSTGTSPGNADTIVINQSTGNQPQNNGFDLGVPFGSISGNLAVSNGATLTSTNLTDVWNGTITVDGPGTVWNSSDMVIGRGGNGSLTVSNGAKVNSTAIGLGVLGANGGNGTLLITGTNSTLNWTPGSSITFSILIGSLTIVNGGLMTLGNNSPISIAATWPEVNRAAALNLNAGGTLQVGGSDGIQGDGIITLAGGTIQVINSTLTTTVSAVLTANTSSPFDPINFSATFSGSLSGDGGFIKTGTGTLTLNTTNTHTGNTTINAGTLLLADPGALQNSTLNFTGGNVSFGSLAAATLGGLSGNQNLVLSLPAANGLNLTVGANNASTTFSGNLSDDPLASSSSSLTKVGIGSLTLTGNLNYGGGTTINAGTLTLSGAKSSASNPTGITVGNASLVIQNGSTLNLNGLILATSTQTATALITGTNTTVTSTGNNGPGLSVGFSGTGNATIANGANVTVGTAELGAQSGGNGTLLVTDANTKLTYVGGTGNPDVLTVGYSGLGALTVANGAGVSGNNGVLGMNNGTVGNATITGANSSWIMANLAEVGFNGTGNLTISNGGSISDAIGVVGLNASANGHVVVTGANSTWINSGTLAVGAVGFAVLPVSSSGGNGSLAISNGGNVSAAALYYGQLTTAFGPTGQNATVSVDGTVSRLAISGNMVGGGNVTITNGGNVTVGGQLTENGYNGTTISLSGFGSQLTVQGYTSVAQFYNNSLTVNGSLLNSVGANSNNLSAILGNTVAGNLTGNATVLVTGNTANWDVGNQTTQVGGLVVGSSGIANLTIANGARVTNYGAAANGIYASIGDQAGSHGSVTVSSATANISTWEIDAPSSNAAALVVGNLGNGTLSIGNGGQVFSSLDIGKQTGSSGSVVITNGGSQAGGTLIVGDAGSGNLTLNAGDSAAQPTSADTAGVAIYAGKSANSTGNITITGSGDNGAQLTNNAGAWVVGNLGTGSLTIANGGYGWGGNNTHDGNGVAADIGNGAGSNGSVLITDANSTWYLVGGSLVIGNLGNATVTIANGANVEVGSNSTNQILLAAGAGSNGTLNLNSGGILVTGGTNALAAGSGQYAINLNGGTLTTVGTDFSTALNATLGGNTTSTINTASANATWFGGLSGSGNLVKTGNFTLTLSGNNTFSGSTAISAGTLLLANSLALQDSTLIYNTNSGNLSLGALHNVSLGGLSGNQDLTLANNSSGSVVLTLGGANQNTTYSGNLTGNGSLLMTGTGEQILSGNNTYAGNTTVNGGTLQFNRDLNVGVNNDSTLTISNGGNLTVAAPGTAYVGVNSGVTGTVSVSGTNSILDVRAVLFVGESGNGNLTVANGGDVSTEGNLLLLGRYNNSTGNLVVTGANSTVNSGQIDVGLSGSGNLTVANGGAIYDSGGLYIAYETSGANVSTALVADAHSLLVAQNDIRIGDFANGTLIVANGGNIVDFRNLYLGYQVNGTVSVSDPASLLHVIGDTDVGIYGAGALTVANGGNVTVSTLEIAYQNTGSGTVLVTDPNSILNTDSMIIGKGGIGNLTVANGGVLAMTSGAILTLASDSGSSGTLNLNSGTLQVGGASGLQAGAGSYAFNFGGGTLKVAFINLTTSINATLVSGTTSTINTTGLNATWSGVLGGSGNLTKAGNSTLTLAGDDTYSGTTTISAGTLIFGGNTSGLNGNVTDNANLTFNPIANTTFAGVISGPGAVSKTAGTTITLTANNTYSGTTTIELGHADIHR